MMLKPIFILTQTQLSSQETPHVMLCLVFCVWPPDWPSEICLLYVIGNRLSLKIALLYISLEFGVMWAQI